MGIAYKLPSDIWVRFAHQSANENQHTWLAKNLEAASVKKS